MERRNGRNNAKTRGGEKKGDTGENRKDETVHETV